MSEAALTRLGYADYLALEGSTGVKHEYLDGAVRAMAGGTVEHGRLASRFHHAIRAALGGRPCEVFSSDVRIRIDASNRTTYADLFVVCGSLERSPSDPEGVTNPVVIVEILSDSTEAYDRGDKFRHYRRLGSLREYVLVSQAERFVEVWRRDGDAWRVAEHGAGGSIELASVGASVPVDVLYDNPLGAGS